MCVSPDQFSILREERTSFGEPAKRVAVRAHSVRGPSLPDPHSRGRAASVPASVPEREEPWMWWACRLRGPGAAGAQGTSQPQQGSFPPCLQTAGELRGRPAAGHSSFSSRGLARLPSPGYPGCFCRRLTFQGAPGEQDSPEVDLEPESQ